MALSPSLFAFMRSLVSLSLFYLIFSASFSLVQPLCHDDESFALLKFKESFTINCSAASFYPSAYPKVSLWKPESGDCCRWRGVKCNENTSHVISLNLSSSCLYGFINSTSTLFQLVHLHSLNLFDNHFNFSRIPTGFRQLSRLTNLNLSYSLFSGQITSEILGLSNLISLDLSRNPELKLQKHGLISIAQKLTNLKDLHLSEVDISSTVPYILANLSSLTSLFLEDCGLHGEFPTGIFHLPNLRSLDVGYNKHLTGRMPEFNRSSPLESLTLFETNFSGEIPDSIGNLKSLYYFDVSDSNFSGSVPSSLGNLTQLISLQLVLTRLHGEFPTRIFHLPNLQSLHVGDNTYLTGRMPEFNRSSPLESLTLFETNFSGEIPDSIGNLKSLYYFDVRYCNFSGSVPSTLGNLTQLISLQLVWTKLHGEFPTRIFHLPNLRFLRVGDNTYLTGRMPEFNRSSPLESLILFETNFSGEIPDSIGNLKSLYYFDVRYCNFFGSVPSSLGNLTQLILLQLVWTRLSGTIPQSISRLVNLTSLDLSSNHLSGTIPQSISRLVNLKGLDLSSNPLSGTIPQSISRLVNLKYLILSSNNLSGTIPQSISKLVNLEDLDLSSNHLSGTVEFDLFLRIKNLYSLHLSHNNISLLTKPSTNATLPKFEILMLGSCDLSEFPDFLRNQDELRMLDLSQNKIHGQIPNWMCNLSSIVALDLSSNSLSGLLPQCLGNLSELLTVLNLHNNKFHGTIPETFAKGNILEMIDFSQNQLHGSLPRSLANCTMLEVLNLGNNQMNDTFPSWLGILPELRVLILRSNGIYGAMGNPNSSFDFPNIRIIDLSHNEIAGKLPSQYFQNWKAMRIVDVKGLTYMQVNGSLGYIYSMTFINKGTEIVYERILDVFMAIDLSNNRFKGEIPEVVGHLKGLKLLNLSNNFLIGPIPSCLGNLTELESLDLSQNNLAGMIPLQLLQLTFLESFNVSHNHLTGPIPQGNQFNTFPNSSFDNNPELCGSPLSKKCGNSKDPPLTFERNQNSDSLFEFSWKVVAMGYGCGFIVGLVVGKIMTKKKHDWFMKTFAIGQPTRRRVN